MAENLCRYVVLTHLECIKELEKAKARIAELEADLASRICGVCDCNLFTDYRYNKCSKCEVLLCENCERDSEASYGAIMCNDCIEKLEECGICQRYAIDFPDKCSACGRQICEGCAEDYEGICEICIDKMHQSHTDVECPGCGEDICVECAKILYEAGHVACCKVSEPHTHCPECSVYIDDE
jgi:hypothetical protein